MIYQVKAETISDIFYLVFACFRFNTEFFLDTSVSVPKTHTLPHTLPHTLSPRRPQAKYLGRPVEFGDAVFFQ